MKWKVSDSREPAALPGRASFVESGFWNSALLLLVALEDLNRNRVR